MHKAHAGGGKRVTRHCTKPDAKSGVQALPTRHRPGIAAKSSGQLLNCLNSE